MTIRSHQIGNITKWTCDTYADIADIESDIGDLLYVVSPGVELIRAVVSVDVTTKNRWVPIDKNWGSNNITMSPPCGVVTNEGEWTISASHALTDTEVNTSYECLALIIDSTGGSVTISVNPTRRPSCLQIKCVFLQHIGGNTATISTDGIGLTGGTGGSGEYPP